MIYIKDKLIAEQIMFELVQSKKPLLKALSILCYNFVLFCSKAYKHTLLVDHSSLLHSKTTYPPQLTRRHMYQHEIPHANLVK